MGCGADERGDVRMDFNEEKRGLNLIGDAQFIPLRTGVFGCVLCRSVLEHVQSPFKALSEMARVSRGWIKVTVPNVHRWARIRKLLLNPLSGVNPDTRHFQAWDGRAFKLLVNQIDGLKIEGISWAVFRGILRRPSILFGRDMIVKMRVEN